MSVVVPFCHPHPDDGERGSGGEDAGSVELRDGFGSDGRDDGGGGDGDGDGGSSESSSIGVARESSLSLCSSLKAGDGEGEEMESKMREDYSLSSMDSLEESLPIKRGLSNFFNGKSKSFANLSDVATLPVSASDIAKPENPFNKRRRILMANNARWPRRASYGALSTVVSLPPSLNSAADLFSLQEGEEEEEEDKKKGTGKSPSQTLLGTLLPLSSSSSSSCFRARKFKDLRSGPNRSFSLGDLQPQGHDQFI